METLNIAIKINKYLRKPRNLETKIKSSPDTVYDKTTMKNILITGGCGFIGSHFLNKNVQELLSLEELLTLRLQLNYFELTVCHRQ